MISGFPTRMSSSAGSASRARRAPGTHSCAPRSPLITSTATDAMRLRAELFFGLDVGRLLDDSLAAIEAVRGNAVPQVCLPRLRVHRQRRLRQGVVRTMHAALRRRFATLLNGHDQSSFRATLLAFQQFAQLCKRFLNL